MIATDTMFSSVQDISGRTCAQVYWGLSSHFINVYGMRTQKQRKVYHPLCKATIHACNVGERVGLNACKIGYAKPNSLNHTTLNRTPPNYMQQNGSNEIAIFYNNALEHPKTRGYMHANIWQMSITSLPMKP